MPATSLITVNDILLYVVSLIAADLDITNADLSTLASTGSVRLTEIGVARRTLAQLARTHSLFKQPALTALWKTLPSDEPLMRLLCLVGIAQGPPHDERGWRESPPGLCGTIATHGSSWTRFQGYATLVRAIIIDLSVQTFDFPSKLLEGTFWSKVSPAFGGQLVLPRLEVATLFSPMSFGLFHFDIGVLSLLNPCLRELNVVFPGVRRELLTFRTVFASCLSVSHNLEVLSVETPISVLDMSPPPQWYPRLRRLKVDDDGIHPGHLALLSSLPNLEYLSIILTPDAPVNIPIAFAKLRSLELWSYDFTGIGLLITHVNAPQLQSVYISETHGDDSDETYPQELLSHLGTIAKKFSLLSAFRWVSRMRSFSGPEEDVPRACTTLADLLDPLLPLRAMRSFSASFTTPHIPYSPADFLKVAEAWPGIETFDLSVAGSRGDQYADLESLTSFARHCPRLRELRVPRLKFDANVSTPVAPVGFSIRHLLRELKVDSVILPTEQLEEATRQREVLSGLIKQTFPFAMFIPPE